MLKTRKYRRYYIGIDTGVKTGFCVYDIRKQRFEFIGTIKIHQAFHLIREYNEFVKKYNETIFVAFEDARLATYYRGKGSDDPKKQAAKSQGAGSVKRDAKAFEDFLEDLKIPYKPIRPNKFINERMYDKDHFKKITGYKKRTSEHARVATGIILSLLGKPI